MKQRYFFSTYFNLAENMEITPLAILSDAHVAISFRRNLATTTIYNDGKQKNAISFTYLPYSLPYFRPNKACIY